MTDDKDLDRKLELFRETRRAIRRASDTVDQMNVEILDGDASKINERTREVYEKLGNTYNGPYEENYEVSSWLEDIEGNEEITLWDANITKKGQVDLTELFEEPLKHSEEIKAIESLIEERGDDLQEEYLDAVKERINETIHLVGKDLDYLNNLEKQVRIDPVYFANKQIGDLVEKEKELQETVDERVGKINDDDGDVRNRLKSYVDAVVDYAQEAEDTIDENVKSEDYFRVLMEIGRLKKKYDDGGFLDGKEQPEIEDPRKLTRMAYNTETWKEKITEGLEEGDITPEEAFERALNVYNHVTSEGKIYGYDEVVEEMEEALENNNIEDPLKAMSEQPKADVYVELVDSGRMSEDEYRSARAFVKTKEEVNEVFRKAYEEGGHEALKNYIDRR